MPDITSGIRKTGSLMDYVKQCADVTPAFIQGIAVAAALNGETYTQFVQGVLDKKPNARPLNRRNCFTCGQLGHFSRTCPKKFKPPPINQKAPSAPETSPALAGGGNQPQILCPRCQKGYHWARDCRSKFHKNGTPSAIVLEQPAAQPS